MSTSLHLASWPLHRELGLRLPLRDVEVSRAAGGLVTRSRDDPPPLPSTMQAQAPIYAMKFCPVSSGWHLLATADEDGNLAVFDTGQHGRRRSKGANGGGQVLLAAEKAHTNACFDLAWSPSEADTIATCSADISTKVWKLKEGSLKCVDEFKYHSRTVKCLGFMEENVLVTASRDNSIAIWDLRSNSRLRPDSAISSVHCVPSATAEASPRRAKKGVRAAAEDGGASGKITYMAIPGPRKVLSSGDKDGVVKLWDLRRSYSGFKGNPIPCQTFSGVAQAPLKGISALVMDDLGRFAYGSCLDSNIYEWDLFKPDRQPSKVFSGCQIKSFFVRPSLGGPNQRLLACGSADANIYLWDVGRQRWSASSGSPAAPQPPTAFLSGHGGEVTCVSWHRGGHSLASCEEEEHKLWRQENVIPEGATEEALDSVIRGRSEASREVDTAAESCQRRWLRGRFVSTVLRNAKCALVVERRLDLVEPATPQSPCKKTVLLKKPGPTVDLPCSPRKMTVTPKKNAQSPRRLNISPRKVASGTRGSFRTPTSSLPNLVRDGPSHRNVKPDSSLARVRKRSSLLAWLGKDTEDVENSQVVANVKNKKRVVATKYKTRKRQKLK